MRKYRILHVVNSMNMGGIEQYVMSLYRNINRDLFQFDFLYFTQKQTFFDDEIEALGGKIYRITGRNENLKKHCQECLQLFAEQKFDVIHIHAYAAYSASVAILAKIRKQGAVFIHSHNTSAHNRHLHLLCKPLLDVFSNIRLACSVDASKWMYTKRGQKSALIMHNAINTAKFGFNAKIRERMRAELCVEDDFVIGNIARFNNQKNHSFLIKVFNEIIRIRPNSKLILVGDGELRPTIESMISNYNLTNKVILTGVVNNVNELLNAFDVFLLPSLYEGLGIVYIEAQANGCPSYASKGVVPPEAKVCELMQFIDLSEGEKKWAETIVNGACRATEDMTDTVASNGYEMSVEVNKMERLYTENSRIGGRK